MSVYNQESRVAAAIDSILAQDYSDFEFIIINDGSTDGTSTLLESYNDHRIKLIHNDNNLYLAASLNKGLAIAQGDFIARMDADDYAYPYRFSAQLEFLQQHADIDVLGTLINFQVNGKTLSSDHRTDDLTIKANIFFTNPFAHPSVFIRRQFLLDHNLTYTESMRWIQDYKLWLDMMAAGARFANLPKACLRYHNSPAQKKIAMADEYRLCAERIWDQQLAWLALPIDEANRHLYYQVAWCKFNRSELATLKRWLEVVAAANKKQQIYPEPAFSLALTKRYEHLRQLSSFGYKLKQLLKSFL